MIQTTCIRDIIYIRIRDAYSLCRRPISCMIAQAKVMIAVAVKLGIERHRTIGITLNGIAAEIGNNDTDLFLQYCVCSK